MDLDADRRTERGVQLVFGSGSREAWLPGETTEVGRNAVGQGRRHGDLLSRERTIGGATARDHQTQATAGRRGVDLGAAIAGEPDVGFAGCSGAAGKLGNLHEIARVEHREGRYRFA